MPISLTHQLQVACGWSTADDTVEIEEVRDRWTMPAGKALGAKCDLLFVNEIYKQIYMTIGAPGTAITDNVTYSDGVAKMSNVSAQEGLKAVLSMAGGIEVVGEAGDGREAVVLARQLGSDFFDTSPELARPRPEEARLRVPTPRASCRLLTCAAAGRPHPRARCRAATCKN